MKFNQQHQDSMAEKKQGNIAERCV